MWLVLAGLSILLVVSAFSDLAHGVIYDWVTLPGIGLGLMAHGLTGGQAGVERALLGLGVGAAVFGLFFLLGSLGGGDVKVMAAVGALGGYPFVLWAMLYTVAIGGVMGLAVLMKAGRQGTVPYGFAIASGTACAWVVQGL